MSDTKSDRTDETFGPYRLDALIGRGGMGQVYRAHDTTRDRDVALKLLHAELATDETFQERFRRECQTLARLGEPHIIPIHDFGEIDGTLFLDMRLVDGRDLRAILAERGPLDPDEAVALVEQVAAALTAAHHAGLVHRDVKPENILVTDESFAYLVDFGVAHRNSDTRLTKTGTAVGSIAYMAPEQFDDTEITGLTDVYSLAAVLYEMLAGSQPYPGESVSTVMRGVLFDEIPVASAANAKVSPAMDAVLAWGMAKATAERCPSAKELAAAARAALHGDAPKVTPTTAIASPEYRATMVAPSTALGAPVISGPGVANPVPSGPAGPAPAGSMPAGSMPGHVISGPVMSGPVASGPVAYPANFYQGAPPAGPRQRRDGNALLIALGLLIALLLGVGGWLAMEHFGGSDESSNVADGSPISTTGERPAAETATVTTNPAETTTVTTTPADTTTVVSSPTYVPGAGSPPSDNQPCPGFPGVGTGYPQWTGCEFAANVRDAYVSSGPMGVSRTVNGWAPQQQKNYVMACAPYAGIVACRGGNQAVVYIY